MLVSIRKVKFFLAISGIGLCKIRFRASGTYELNGVKGLRSGKLDGVNDYVRKGIRFSMRDKFLKRYLTLGSSQDRLRIAEMVGYAPCNDRE